MYFLLGISIAFAFLLVVNLLAAVSASAIWSAVSGHISGFSARAQARIIFGLRTMPVAAAFVFVIAFVVPSYVIYEPASTGEVVSLKLAVIAIASSLGIAVAGFRVLNTWLATRRLIAAWLETAERITITDSAVPAYRIEHPFPVIAVVGIFRPRMFIAAKVLDTLGPAEFSAAIAHECGHLKAFDNLKRTVLRVCRDVLVLPIGNRLDQAWTENAETVADEYAAGRGRTSALDLASALVKIARIVPANASPAMPAGTFLLEEHNADVTSRVRRLVRISEGDVSPVRQKSFGYFPSSWLWSLGLIVLVLMPLIDARLLASTHEAIERFVRILQ